MSDDNQAPPTAETRARIQARRGGPFKVTGDFELVDCDGNVIDTGGRATVWLCRCGASANKPFCDGKHNACGFMDR